MSQQNYIDPGELIKAIAQELLKSSLKIKSAELNLKVAVKNEENGSLKISVLESVENTDSNNFHTLKVIIFDGTDDQHGGFKPQSSNITDRKIPKPDGSGISTQSTEDPRGG